MARKINQMPEWPDARGWIGLGTFFLTVMVLWMIAGYPELRKDEFFKAVAMLLVGTGFVNGVVSWAYSATKSGGELADKNAAIVHESAAAAVTTASALAATVTPATEPQRVEVVNTSEKPVPTTTDDSAAPEGEVPDYAQ